MVAAVTATASSVAGRRRPFVSTFVVAPLQGQPAAVRLFGAAMRAGLKDTLFPDDPFRGLGGMPPAWRAWRVARYFVGGHVVTAGGVHRRWQGEGLRRPTAVHAARLHVGLLHRRPVGRSWIPQVTRDRYDRSLRSLCVFLRFPYWYIYRSVFAARLGILMDFMSRPAITGFMGGMAVVIMLQQLKGIVGMTHFTTKKVSAFVVGAVALIATPFAVPSASFTRDVGRAVAERAERDGGHGRGEAKAPRGGRPPGEKIPTQSRLLLLDGFDRSIIILY
uniref:SLC26A/SulP transporter domain-containing protein n=1 Tax=Oryza nivara TaxID=4536 RepID=A0A0E0IBU4_ORYNI